MEERISGTPLSKEFSRSRCFCAHARRLKSPHLSFFFPSFSLSSSFSSSFFLSSARRARNTLITKGETRRDQCRSNPLGEGKTLTFSSLRTSADNVSRPQDRIKSDPTRNVPFSITSSKAAGPTKTWRTATTGHHCTFGREHCVPATVSLTVSAT